MPETIQDLMPETPDLNQERLETLKGLMPDIFTDEGKLDEKQLKQILEFASGEDKPLHAPETYEFNWFGKAKAKEQAFTPTRLTLEYDPKRSFNAEHSENVIIEGENLEVLKLLVCGYRGKIKCIYIDPPYNTGKDFVYSDKHATEYKEYLEKTGKMRDGIKTDANADTSGRYHSDWLSMMYSRLIVAQQLLRKDGVIFISIDDNEVHNLRKLCDDVFGMANFVGTLAVVNNLKGRNDKKNVAQAHEYLMIYGKSDALKLVGLPLTEAQKAEYKFTDENGEKYALRDLRRRGMGDRREDRPQMFFPLYYDKATKKLSLERTSPEEIEIIPKRGDLTEGRWRWGALRVGENLGILEAKYSKKKDRWDIDHRVYLNQATGGAIPGEDDLDEDEEPQERVSKSKSLWMGGDLSTDVAKRELKSLIPDVEFDFPKPVSFIKRILHISDSRDEIFLDFFAGTGTSAQAVVELNHELGTNTKFILVQIPEILARPIVIDENKLATLSDLTIERSKRVAEAMNSNPDNSDEARSNGFKVFTLEKSYFPRTEWTPEPGMDEAAKLASLRAYIAEKEGQQTLDYDQDKLLTEVLIKEGFKLTYKAVRREDFPENTVYNVTDGEREAVVCLDPSLTDATVKQLRTLIDKKVVVIERALDTTKKWNLHNDLGEKFRAF